MEQQYIYIVQALLEPSRCKIGKTNDIDSITGKSKLFTCEVSNSEQVKTDIKEKFLHLHESTKREIYFYNPVLFKSYVEFIKKHRCFVKEISIKTDAPKPITKTVKKTTPSLDERGIESIDLIHKARRTKNDEFYTRYEDVEKELAMYDKSI